MKPFLLQTLKELALLGAIKNKVEISTIELAKQIDSSQQTSSRYLVELDKKGFITREMGIKKQLIEITENGMEVLKEEYLQYLHIFELTDKIHFIGKVVSGMGEGKYYTSQKGYVDQFKSKLGFVPYPGTLNVEIEPIERNKLRLLKNYNAIDIEEFITNNRSFGGVRCFPAQIGDLPGAIVLPVRGHYSNVLELISPDFLRQKLSLNDGSKVKIVILLGE